MESTFGSFYVPRFATSPPPSARCPRIFSMADTDAAAQAPEGRLILLPVDLDEASITAVSWAARHVLRNGASSMAYCLLRGAADAAPVRERCLRAASGSWTML